MGGEVGSGRWHTPSDGKRIVYLAEHPALALIESLVNLRAHRDFLPDSFQLLKIEVPSEIAVESCREDDLPEDWKEDFSQTQTLGNEWLARRTSALISVPSAPSPESSNYLLNPLHPDAAACEIVWSRWIRYDKRFFRTSE